MHTVSTEAVTSLTNALEWESGELNLCSALSVTLQSSYFASQTFNLWLVLLFFPFS